jgi:16S rRNA (guanine1207-N2)-methyltransferase
LSARAIEINCETKPIHDLADLAGPYDLVLARVPKNLSFFEDELAHLGPQLAPGAQIVCGYMVKHHAKSAFELLEKYVGPVTTSLARKKARLIFATFSHLHTPAIPHIL